MAASFGSEEFFTRVSSTVSRALAHVDSSHDFSHVERVHTLAVRIAKEEGLDEAVELPLVRAAALLHDVDDYKYSGSDAAARESVARILAELETPAHTATLIQAVVAGVSFHGELAGVDRPAMSAEDAAVVARVCACVQDADSHVKYWQPYMRRLEAIGAVGVARCLTFGGSRARPLYDADVLNAEWRASVLGRQLSMEEYKACSSTTLGHFYAKLLKLRDLMKTRAGRRIAEDRHTFMGSFLEQFFDEVAGSK